MPAARPGDGLRLLSQIDPGDEVIVFEPFFETYVPDLLLCGSVPVFVELHEPDFASTPRNCAALSRRAPAPSSSTRRTTPPAECSTQPNWA
ncbi:MAG: hypothetical protein U0531_04530 [Dehalococcoidia bacterium]